MYTMSESLLGQKLNRLLVEGPPVGVHLILSFSGVRPMTHVVDERRSLLNFRHRVALQMSEDESLMFVRSRRAAQLQADGPVPVCALYMDVEHDKVVRFKPYTIESTIDFAEQLHTLGKQMTGWRVAHEQSQ
jgi:S-DNA-T family DNA segregation ATPase FtsK/SpoIIIE